MKGIHRPRAHVLPSTALIPNENLIEPAPTRFTHVVATKQPYFYTEPRPEQPPDGYFESGTPLSLLTRAGGLYCRVACARGLSVFTEYAPLAPFPEPAQSA